MSAILSDTPAPLLSDYGLFSDAAANLPVENVVPYDLMNPLFSDYAIKHRYMFTPPGTHAAFRDGGLLDLPVGTVLVKTFSFAPDMREPDESSYKVETRLLIHKPSGWAALPYVWNDTGTEAVYTPVGTTRTVDTRDPAGSPLRIKYAVPNKNQCKTCHQAGDSVRPIGPKARNLNHPGPSGENQLAALQAIGWLSGLPAVAPRVPDITDTSASLNDRARAYLDINCGHCHNAAGSASNSGLWLTFEEENPVRYGIGKHPTAAGRGAGNLLVVIDPGYPDRSILPYRMASNEAGIAMPELGRSIVDSQGVDLISDWIAEMDND